MTHLFRELQRREARGNPVRTAVVGAGFMGKGLVYQLSKMPGMHPALVCNRTVDKAVAAYVESGYRKQDIFISDDPERLANAVAEKRPCVSCVPEIAGHVSTLDVVIEATGAVELGAREALSCIKNKKHFISLNAETDGTIGCLLKQKAAQAGVVFSKPHGGQPAGVMRASGE